MTSQTVLRCDVPACRSTKSTAGFNTPVSTNILRLRAKNEGWNTTSVANPFYDEVSRETRRINLDRCPQHTRAKLRVKKIDDSTYTVERLE